MKHFPILLVLLCTAMFAFAQTGHSSKKSFYKHLQQSASRQSGGFIYSLETSNEPYEELTGATSVNNGEIWDDPLYVVVLPFDITINETVTNFLAFVGLGGLFAAPTGNEDEFSFLFAFECDLLDRGELTGEESLSPISYVIEGDPGSRIVKVEFKNAGSWAELDAFGTMDMFINFQMWVYEGSNRFEFRFGPSNIDDPSTFYEGLPGAIIGTADYDEANDILSNGHLLGGSAANPNLSTTVTSISGTPANGTVYTLFIDVPLAVELDAEDVTEYCEPNGSITSTVLGGIPPYTYLWSNGETTPDLINLDAGTYTLTVTDQSGATSTASATIITTVEPMSVEVSVTHETEQGANDGTATVTASDGFAPYLYFWSNGQTTQTVENLAPGIYTVTVVDNAGCNEVSTAQINAFGCPELSIEATMTELLCYNDCNGMISVNEIVNGVAPFTYTWSNGDGDNVAENLCAGTYSVTVTDEDNCIITAEWTLIAPSQLIASAGATDETLLGANDGTAYVESTGGVEPFTYLWSNDSTGQQIIELSPGEYSVIVTDANNCSAYDTVVVASGPCAILTGIVHDVSCFGLCDGSIDLPPGWAFYVWSNGSSAEDLSALCPGIYSVTVDDAEGCTAETSFIVNESAPVMAHTGHSDETIAGGDGSAWVIPAGGITPYTYEWSNGSVDSLITGLIADTYTITLTDANGCADTAYVTIAPFVCFSLLVDEVQHAFCHDSCDGLIFLDPTGGVGPFEFAWSHGDTANVTFDLCAGLYGVTVTDVGQGCSVSSEIWIVQPDSFYYTIDTIIHQTDTTSGSISVSFFGGMPPYHALWTGPNNFSSLQEDISGLVPGSYVLFLFDNHDCDITDTIEILDMTTGIPFLSADDISIYPNPATGQLNISSGLSGEFGVRIYNNLGKELGYWKNKSVVDVSGFVSGMYMIRFEHERGIYVERVVVE